MGQLSSVYWTDEEYKLLRELAAQRGTATNSVARIALRLLLGLPVPSWAAELRASHDTKEVHA